MLSVNALGLRFGGIQAIEDITFQTRSHEVLGLIGPNGAGKTSLFNCITGFYKPTSGDIYLDGVKLTGWRPHRISRLGIRRTFQNVRLFGEYPVLANIMAGAHVMHRPEEEMIETCQMLCDDLQIDESYFGRPCCDLPLGIQRRVELARALIAQPKVLLVDEPGAGLIASEKQLIVSLLRRVATERPLSVVLIEHDLGMIVRACDRVIVLDRGKILSTGSPDEIRRDPAVISAYLGS
jgi:branched-chain amino acid transport system ATP-binding protein